MVFTLSMKLVGHAGCHLLSFTCISVLASAAVMCTAITVEKTAYKCNAK